MGGPAMNFSDDVQNDDGGKKKEAETSIFPRSKRRLSKKERKALKQKKKQQQSNKALPPPPGRDDSSPSLVSSPGSKKVPAQSDDAPNDASMLKTERKEKTRKESTTVDYLADYVPVPLPRADRGGRDDAAAAATTLGKWFPNAISIKSSINYSNTIRDAAATKNDGGATSGAGSPSPTTTTKKKKKKKRKRKNKKVEEDGRVRSGCEGGIPTSGNAVEEGQASVGTGSGDDDGATGPSAPPTSSLVLFYQYATPAWSTKRVDDLVRYLSSVAHARPNLGGRIRVAPEGVNATVSAADYYPNGGENNNDGSDRGRGSPKAYSAASTLRHFAEDLRRFDPAVFADTDFKYIDALPADRHFKDLKLLPVRELVFYGLRDDEAPLSKGGVHLPPEQYHEMLGKKDTVVIDVRNHYEAAIGRFDGQMRDGRVGAVVAGGDIKTDDSTNEEEEVNFSNKGGGKKGTTGDCGDVGDEATRGDTGTGGEGGAEYIDPLMRKSTDFPAWLSKPETRQKLEGKTVLMYCTGGVRCERASAYLNNRMGSQVNGVYQLQGGIERYLQAFPDGGYWTGKNFVFDKRGAIGAGNAAGDGGVVRKTTATAMRDKKKRMKAMRPSSSSKERTNGAAAAAAVDDDDAAGGIEGKEGARCVVCSSPWDRYVGKKKCYTCGVPVLMCDGCMSKKPDRVEGMQLAVRCPLCVGEGVTVPASEVEYTDNGVHVGGIASFRPADPTEGGNGGGNNKVADDKGGDAAEAANERKEEKKCAKSVLKWGGGHARKKKEKRKMKRRLCQFGSECVRKDCFFYHPERDSGTNVCRRRGAKEL